MRYTNSQQKSAFARRKTLIKEKKKEEEIKENLRKCFSLYYVEIKPLNIYCEFLIPWV